MKLNSGVAGSLLMLVLGLVACAPESAESQMAAARTAMGKREFKAAEVHLKTALQQDSSLKEARLLLAQALLEAGDFGGAETNLAKAEELGIDAQVLSTWQAKVWLGQGKPKLVLERLSAKRLEVPADDALLRTLVAKAHASLGQFDAAGQAIDAALAIDSNRLDAHLLRIRILYIHRKYDEALELTKKVEQFQPQSAENLLLRGLIQARQQAPAQTIVSSLQGALKADPKYADAHAALAEISIETKEYSRAKVVLANFADLHPRDLRPRLLTTALHLRQNELKLAQENAQELMKLAPTNGSALAMAGAVSLASRDWLQAENRLAKALTESPESTMVRVMLAHSQVQMGAADKALATVRVRLDTSEPQADLLAVAGAAYLLKGEVRKAESALEAAIKSAEHKQAAPRLGLAMLRISNGREAQGLQDLEVLADQEQKASTALLALISSRMRLGHVEKALEAIATLSSREPKSPLGPYLRGQVEVGRRNKGAARQAFDEALRRDAQHFPSASALAAMDFAEGAGAEKAKTRFASVLEANPRNVDARLAVIRINSSLNPSASSLTEQLQSLVKDAPTASEPRIELIKHFVSIKDNRQALAAAQQAADAIPGDVRILEALGRMQILNGEHNQALSTFGKWANAQPGSATPLLRLAEVEMGRKNWSAAVDHLKQALSAEPHDMESQKALVAVALQQGNYEAALAMARSMQIWPPQRVVGHVIEGDIEAARKQWAPALRAYSKAQELEPRESAIAIKFHQVLAISGESEKAGRYADDWIKRNAQGTAYILYVADQAAQSGQLERAERYFEKALENEPDSPVISNNLAWLRVKLKRANALELALRANARQPGVATVLDTLASAYEQAGRPAEALTALEEAVRLAPKNIDYRLHLTSNLVRSGRTKEAQRQLDEVRTLGPTETQQAELSRLAALAK